MKFEKNEIKRNQLEGYKEKLVNFSKRNRELFYKPTRGASLNLSSYSFDPKSDKNKKEEIEKKFQPIKINSDNLKSFLLESKLDLKSHYLFDKFENHSLAKVINKIRLSDQKFQKEYGISGGWFLGPFLVWKTKSNGPMDENFVISPILKTPIDIIKGKNNDFSLQIENQKISTNLTLQLILNKTFGIKMPTEIEGEDLVEELKNIIELFKNQSINIEYLPTLNKLPNVPKTINFNSETYEENVKKNSNFNLEKWEYDLFSKVNDKNFLLLDIFHLDHLNIIKLTLLKDFDEIMEQSDLHPIIEQLMLGVPIANGNYSELQIRELDNLKERDNHFLVEIDSSQHLAIYKANNQNSLVIQGPPGTGKSQTITNLIADLIVQKKKVLFVAEKRAALDVVYNRLKMAGIEKHSVIIHSSELNKKDLYSDFLTLAKTPILDNYQIKSNIEENSDRLDFKKKVHNHFLYSLKKIEDCSKLSVQDILTLKSQNKESAPDKNIREVFGKVPYSIFMALADDLIVLKSLCNDIEHLKNHPWRNKKENLILLSSLSFQVNSQIQEIKTAIAIIKKADEYLKSINPHEVDPGLENSFKENKEKIKKVDSLILAASFNLFFKPTPLNIVDSLKENLRSSFEKLNKGLVEFELIKSGTDIQLIYQLNNYFKNNTSVFRYFTPAFWEKRKKFNSIINKKLELKPQDVLGPYITFYEQKNILDNILFDLKFPVPLDNSEYLKLIKEMPINLTIAKEIFDFLKKINLLKEAFPYDKEMMEDLFCEIQAFWENFNILINKKIELKNLEKNFLENFFNQRERIPVEIKEKELYLQKILDSIDDISKISKLDYKIKEVESNFKLVGLKELLYQSLIDIQKDWTEEILSQLIDYWYDNIILNNHEILNNHNPEESQKTIEGLVNNHKSLSKNKVEINYQENLKKQFLNPQTIRLLEKEANKSKRILSPREVMERGALQDMMNLKPCWLMSPLSISQILPNISGLFDVIIFDEASQVRVEDALPSIFRSKQMIIVGDKQQMPPTSFFDSGLEADDDEVESIELEKSILDLSSQIYPSEMLKWHYRSRAESLISFSNRAFYNGDLIATPNPSSLASDGAIIFEMTKGATFNSKTGGNPVEAQKVISYAAEILKKDPDSSVGIIAFGTAQMKALEDELEKLENSDTLFGKCLSHSLDLKKDGADAGFFIKNLENVQGDERDHIILSVGYAPDPNTGKLRKGFGPLSTAGGGKRLNVAITRAKQKISIFCSFDPKTELSIDSEAFGKNPDSTHFARYLNYAQAISEKNIAEVNRILGLYPTKNHSGKNNSDSMFALDLKKELEKLGHNVISNVGSNGFFVELVVVDPDDENKFILGIELDSANSNAIEYCRDRDIARQKLLELKGWKLTKVWSYEWCHNRNKIILNLDNQIKRIIESEILVFLKIQEDLKKIPSSGIPIQKFPDYDSENSRLSLIRE